MPKTVKSNPIGKYEKKKVPRIAQVVDDYVMLARKFNATVWGMSYIDATDSRKFIREYYEKTGYKISFTAFLIACFSRAVEKFKYPINTYHRRMRYYYTFDDVDVQTNIERTLPSGIKKPLNYTIRKASEKTLKQINDELQDAKQVHPKGIVTKTSTNKPAKFLKLFPKLPRFLRRIVLRIVLHNPLLRKKMMGTVNITAVGMLAKPGTRGFGHGIFMTPHSCSIAVAGLEKKAIVVEDKQIIREVIALTFAFDHRVIDGGPATRFGTEFLYIVEQGYKDADWCFKSL